MDRMYIRYSQEWADKRSIIGSASDPTHKYPRHLFLIMDARERFDLITRNTEEVVDRGQLMALLEKGEGLRGYIGYEPSGYLHVAQGYITASKVIDMQRAGVEMTILLADWHAYINEKMNGVMEDIQACAGYMRECYIALGVDPAGTTFRHASELVRDPDYWQTVIDIGKHASLSRVMRALTIMGRKEGSERTDVAKFIYPLMQVADIYYMDLDIAYAGMDQRRAHMLARDTAERLHRKKPVAVHTPIIGSLQGPGRMEMDAKMSKSRPDTAVYLHDADEDITRKLMKAYCPERVVDANPVLDLVRHIVLPLKGEFRVEREMKHGGDVHYASAEMLVQDYTSGSLHPLDLKRNLARDLVELVAPVRERITRSAAFERMREATSRPPG